MPVGKETAVHVNIFDTNGRIELQLSCVLRRLQFVLPPLNRYPPITNAMIGSWGVCDIRTFLNVRINRSNFAQRLVRRDLHFSRVITDYLMCHELQ